MMFRATMRAVLAAWLGHVAAHGAVVERAVEPPSLLPARQRSEADRTQYRPILFDDEAVLGSAVPRRRTAMQELRREGEDMGAGLLPSDGLPSSMIERPRMPVVAPQRRSRSGDMRATDAAAEGEEGRDSADAASAYAPSRWGWMADRVQAAEREEAIRSPTTRERDWRGMADARAVEDAVEDVGPWSTPLPAQSGGSSVFGGFADDSAYLLVPLAGGDLQERRRTIGGDASASGGRRSSLLDSLNTLSSGATPMSDGLRADPGTRAYRPLQTDLGVIPGRAAGLEVETSGTARERPGVLPGRAGDRLDMRSRGR